MDEGGEDRLSYFIVHPLLLSLFKTCTDAHDCVNERLAQTFKIILMKDTAIGLKTRKHTFSFV